MTNWIVRSPHFIAGIVMLATMGVGSSSAQQVALQSDRQALQENARPRNPVRKPQVATAVAATDPVAATSRNQSESPVPRAKGPYYVDFRLGLRPATGTLSSGSGRPSERKVEVAGLHPAGDFCRTYWDI